MNKDIINKSIDLFLLLMFALPIFPTILKSIIIGLFGISIILYAIINKLKFSFKNFIISSSIFFVLILSLFYTENIDYGLKKLVTMISLVLFPFLFSFSLNQKIVQWYKNINLYLWTYIASILILNIVAFIYHFGHYKFDLITHYITVTRIAQGGYNIHPIYLSMHLCVAIIFSIFIFSKEKKKAIKVIILLINTILILFLFLLLKKGPIIGLFIVITIYTVFKNSKKIKFAFMLFIFISITSIFIIPKLNKKFVELIKIENINQDNIKSSTNIRYSIYEFAIKAFKSSPIIGHGIGDYRDVLNETYKGESEFLYKKKYNTHNQYLSFLTSIGLLGLLIYLFNLLKHFNNAFKRSNLILILLLVFYSFVMISENILEREDGVIFFSFFINFFALKSISKIPDEL